MVTGQGRKSFGGWGWGDLSVTVVSSEMFKLRTVYNRLKRFMTCSFYSRLTTCARKNLLFFIISNIFSYISIEIKNTVFIYEAKDVNMNNKGT